MDNHQPNDSRMMWLMMLCCLAPLALIWLAGRGMRLPSWGVFAVMALIFALHLFFHRKHSGHAGSGHGNDAPKQQPGKLPQSDEHSK